MAAPRSYWSEARKLTEARIQFALKCMRTVIQKKGSENVVFSPYNIYEGLLMVYFASSGDTEIHLRRILQLPDDISKQDWILHHQWHRNKTNRGEAKEYYGENICWIKNTKRLKDIVQDVFNPTKCCFLDCSDIPKLIKLTSKELKQETLRYIHNPVELNQFNENMDFILSSVLSCEDKRFEPVCKNLLPGIHLLRKPITVLSPKLGTFMTELPYINQTHSMFLLFPAVQSDKDRYKWEIDNRSISGLIERLTTEEGTDELRKVLDFSQQPPKENLILPDSFNLEYDLSIDELLQDLGIQQLLEPDHSSLSNFSDEHLHLGGAMHRAYVRMSSTHVTAGAINIFFTKNGGSFKSIEETKYCQYEQSFVWLIYDRLWQIILFVGVINKDLPQVSSSEHTASSSNTVELKQ
ncbi:unnamed protein product [Lasius platythorax]|uniref:Serpin domain-containing protein n=1 Tax=Lasius platythorax TaxID=488582 RepID=A0AAV2NHC1_9HYME